MKFCLTPLAYTVVLTSAEDTQMPPGYGTNIAQLTRPFRTWRCPATGTPNVTLDLGSSQTLGAIAVAYTTAVTIKVEGSVTSSTTGFSTIAAAAPMDVEPLSQLRRGWIALNNANRWWRLTVQGLASGDYELGGVALCALSAIEVFLPTFPAWPVNILHARQAIGTASQGTYQVTSGHPLRAVTAPMPLIPRTVPYQDQLRRLHYARKVTAPLVLYEDRNNTSQVLIGYIDPGRSPARGATWMSEDIRFVEFS